MVAPSKTVIDQLHDATEIIKKKNAELLEARKLIENLRKADDTAATIRENIHRIAAYDPAPPEWTIRPGIAGQRGVPATIWSDWHYSEVVDRAQVGGVNEFNKTIAKRRIKKLVETTCDLAVNHMGRAKIKYPGCVVALGGDMLGGDIHEELMRTNDRTTQQAINDLTDLIAGGLETMATTFGKVFVPCVVGNHGRSTKKMQMKERVFTSHEWNVYCSLARHFKRSKHVQFLIPEEADCAFNIFDHRYLLTHGDSLGVKGGDGIIGALGPIMRGTLKTHRNQAQINRDFDTLLIGHWHQYITLPGLICNNTLKGYDEYALLALRAPFSRPSQALWFSHPEHGITAHWQVYLEPKLNQDKDAKRTWVSWEAFVGDQREYRAAA
jgi:hypothetical protein